MKRRCCQILTFSFCIVLLLPLLFYDSEIYLQAATKRIDCELTEEEEKFIANSDVVRVALSPDNFPYSSVADGEMTGIFPELLSLISYETGLQFEIIPCDTYWEYTQLKKKDDTDLVLATHVTEWEAEQAGYQLTSPYLSIPYSKIELRENMSSLSRVAALEKPSAEATEAAKYYYSDQILYCGSMQECFDALDQNQCESVIINSYEAEFIQYSDIKNKYVLKELYDNTIEISAGVNLHADPMLYEIMEKVLTSIDELTKEEIINRNTQKIDRDASLLETVYSNPVLFLVAVAIFFFMIVIMVILVFRVKRISYMEQKSEEYKRFVGYICMAVDTVTEIDLYNRTITRYLIKNGVVQEETEPYPEDVLSLFHEDDREKVKMAVTEEALKALCVSGKAVYNECRMKWNHGTEYRYSTCILQGIIPSKEKPCNLLLILKDTNEVKTNEEKQRKALLDAFELAKQASQAKGTFLSKMSHEIRTPLNAIIGYLTIAKDSDRNIDKIMHCIDNSEIAAEHLLHIINDVLDISSIESGKMKIAYQPFDLKKEITDISTIFYQSAKNKGVIFEVHIENLTEECVVGDSLRLNQALMNLLSNAVKFTPEKGIVQLKIIQLEKDEKTVYIQFVVTDTGIGMSEEYMSRLFQPFEQESSLTAQKYGGTGLGLSITGNLVKMMGGTIEVKSEQEKGSTFVVTMHFDCTEEKKEDKITNVDYSHVRALVVDDQKDEGTYINAMLKRCGIKSDSVLSGEKALKRIKSRQEGEYAYDICILDWNMPQMNGMELAARIREEFGKEIPIIIATAYDITEIEEEAMKIGVNKVVAKPLFQSTLFDLIVSQFGRYEPCVDEKKQVKDMTGLRIILAEDNEMNMDIAVTILHKAGLQIDQAVNGEEAYELFVNSKQGTYSLILMDVQMPVLNGYEATKKIRNSNHPNALTIPIIAMTANAFAEDVAEALASGMNAHIAKPINYDKLFQVLEKFLWGRDR